MSISIMGESSDQNGLQRWFYLNEWENIELSVSAFDPKIQDFKIKTLNFTLIEIPSNVTFHIFYPSNAEICKKETNV